MSDTRRAMHMLDARQADLDVVGVVLGARSNAEAAIAFMLLRESFPPEALVMLANLRELIAEMPDTPFIASGGLDLLATARNYEPTGHSYRKLFESDHGIYGLEFVGSGSLCEAIIVHTATSRLVLRGDTYSVIDAVMLNVLVNHQTLLDEILEALQLLGWPLEPKIHLVPDDFLAEYGAAAASEAFGELF